MAVPHTFSSGPIFASEVNDNFQNLDGRATANRTDVDALKAAPPAHAGSHKSGGSDALMKAGTVTVSLDGVGAGSTTFAHGLAGSPRFALVSFNAFPGGGGPACYATVSGTNVTVGMGGGPGNGTVTINWAVFL